MDKVPNEVMLEIFSQLEHNDLYRCMRVSKSFKALVEHPAFDKVLFRSKKAIPGYDLVDPEKLQLHPAFKRLRYLCRQELSDVIFMFRKESINKNNAYTFTPLTETSAAERRATEPAVTCLTISPYGSNGWDQSYTAVIVENQKGVTVLDVMKGLCKYYTYGGIHRISPIFEGFEIARRSPLHKHVILFGLWGILDGPCWGP